MQRWYIVCAGALVLTSALTVAVLTITFGPARHTATTFGKAQGVRPGQISFAQFVPCPNGSCKILAPPQP